MVIKGKLLTKGVPHQMNLCSVYKPSGCGRIKQCMNCKRDIGMSISFQIRRVQKHNVAMTIDDITISDHSFLLQLVIILLHLSGEIT